MEDQKSKVQGGSAKDAESSLDQTDTRPMADHLDLFQQIYRDGNEEGDRLAHEAREKGASWNSFTIKEGAKISMF